MEMSGRHDQPVERAEPRRRVVVSMMEAAHGSAGHPSVQNRFLGSGHHRASRVRQRRGYVALHPAEPVSDAPFEDTRDVFSIVGKAEVVDRGRVEAADRDWKAMSLPVLDAGRRLECPGGEEARVGRHLRPVENGNAVLDGARSAAQAAASWAPTMSATRNEPSSSLSTRR
jgi:hypothetical protein